MGSYLRRAREQRALTLSEIADATKVPRATLERLERGDLAGMPAEVFVRGFIRSYAKVVGVVDSEPLALYDRALAARSQARRAQPATPVTVEATAGSGAVDEERETPRRGLGLAVFVIILLVIATITLSLLLRRPPQSGEGLSEAPRPVPAAIAPTASA